MSFDRPLVIGAGGQLGSAFVRTFDNSVPVGRNRLDLATADAGAVGELIGEVRPDLVINCAAYTAVDKAEEQEELATNVNGRAVGEMAGAVADAGLPFVTFSTDYVFAGNGHTPYLESDPVDPVNAYGRSKLLGEELALTAHVGALVVRTSWVISGTHPNFVATMLRLSSQGKPLRVVDDQVGCPSVVDDIVAGTVELVTAGASGIVHLTNTGETTWFGLASAALDLAGISGQIEPCSTEEYPTPARRPAYSVLGSERRRGLGVTEPPHWRNSLAGVVQSLLASPPG